MQFDSKAHFGFSDPKTKTVEIPEWEASVFVRQWTGSERANFLNWWEAKNHDLFHSHIAVLSLSDKDGNRLFTDEDEASFANKSITALERIAAVALSFNGLGVEKKA